MPRTGPLFSRRSRKESMQNTDVTDSGAFSGLFVHSRERQRSKWILAGGAGEELLGSGQPAQPSQHPLNARPHESQTLRKQGSWGGDSGEGKTVRGKNSRSVRDERLTREDGQNDRGIGVHKTQDEEPQTREHSPTPWDAVSLSSTGCECQNFCRCII